MNKVDCSRVATKATPRASRGAASTTCNRHFTFAHSPCAPVIVGALLALALVSAPAHAATIQTWVSGKGNDSNPCTREAPCLTFARALTQTEPGGKIDVLDSANYGPVTITQAVTITNDGAVASIQGPAGGNAITVNAGAKDEIHLRGLTINGNHAAAAGIMVSTGGYVEIIDCTVLGFAGPGIMFNTSNLSNQSIIFSILNTQVSGNSDGIDMLAFGSNNRLSGTIRDTRVSHNDGLGIYSAAADAHSSSNVTVVDSVSSFNVTGVAALSGSITLRNSVVSNNTFYGISVTASPGTPGTVRLGNSVVTRNKAGANVVAGGTIETYDDNYLDGNGTEIGQILSPVKLR